MKAIPGNLGPRLKKEKKKKPKTLNSFWKCICILTYTNYILKLGYHGFVYLKKISPILTHILKNNIYKWEKEKISEVTKIVKKKVQGLRTLRCQAKRLCLLLLGFLEWFCKGQAALWFT